jgi:ABC-type Mn2+/Zn2+ transport system permease subunit
MNWQLGAIKFISVVVLTFALALVVLGIITMWLERERRRFQGGAMLLVGLLVGIVYAFLASRISEALFGRLIVALDLPNLMATAFTYTAGVLFGAGMAAGIFLWATNRYRRQSERAIAVFVVAGLAVALVATTLAIILSTP